MKYKLSIGFLLVGFAGYAQNSVEVSGASKAEHRTSVVARKVVKSSTNKKHPYDWYYDQKIEEYKKRMEENEKKYEKLARLMEKPQFSDPSYFGHKHKPRKRPPGKRKFCKECEIVH